MAAITEVAQTLQVLKHSIEVTPVDASQHQAAIEAVTGRRIMPLADAAKRYAAYYDTFVAERFVRQFPYAANVRERHTVVYKRHFDDPVWYPILYTGDIPDAALTRIQDAIQRDIACLTIHSLKPLPVTRGLPLVLRDPVVVGWLPGHEPCIRIGSWPKKNRVVTFDGWGTQGGALGVVIAVWDIEGELHAWQK